MSAIKKRLDWNAFFNFPGIAGGAAAQSFLLTRCFQGDFFKVYRNGRFG